MSEQPADLLGDPAVTPTDIAEAPQAAESATGRRRRPPFSAADTTGGAGGMRNPKVLLLALGGVAILGVAGWALVLPALTGSSTSTAATAPVIHHVFSPTRTLKTTPVTTKAKVVAPPLLLAADFAGVIGRDPFKPLVVDLPAPVATPAAAAPVTGSAAAPSSTIKVVLQSIDATSKGGPYAHFLVNGAVNVVVIGDKFATDFQVNDIASNFAMIQFGDASPVSIQLGATYYFVN